MTGAEDQARYPNRGPGTQLPRESPLKDRPKNHLFTDTRGCRQTQQAGPTGSAQRGPNPTFQNVPDLTQRAPSRREQELESKKQWQRGENSEEKIPDAPVKIGRRRLSKHPAEQISNADLTSFEHDPGDQNSSGRGRNVA